MKDTLQTIRRSSRHFFSGTLLSRVTGMLRDVSMAYVFGTQSSIAAFMVAFRFAHLLRRLFGEGALQSAFIPEFETLRHQDEQRAFIFFRDLTLVLTFFLTFLIGISCSVLSACLWWGNLHPENQEIVFLTLLMLPSLLFICLFGLNSSFLQCEKSYFIPSVAPVAFNMIWIVSVFSLKYTPANEAMPWLSFGVVIACFSQWLMTLPQTWKRVKDILNCSLWSSFDLRLKDLYRLSKPLALGLLGVAASQINSAIDSLFARFVNSEGPALLWYAIRIQQLPLALFGIAIAGAILPPLSRALKAHQWTEYHQFLQHALYYTWLFILPFTAALFLLGDMSVSLLYGRGDFDSHSIIQTTHCLWAYSLGLIPSAFVLVLAPASYAQNNYFLPAMAALATMLLNLFLNTLFIKIWHWGTISVALSTSISAWINLFLLGWSLFKTTPSLFFYKTFKQFIPISIGTIFACWVTYQTRALFQQMPFFPLALFSSSFYSQMVNFCCQLIIFGTSLYISYFLSICFKNKRILFFEKL